ncbi:hypothetical protein BFR04_03230 [Gaetbulibacter sp. 4G1]|nr:hypothetical protein [Gaetbulibacter sp. 4G1]PIA78561.1 hypothetical protein BFR04_03230 [Gaetbulibacter sp. 4G1]
MAQFNNQLPVSVSIRYTATDGQQPLQHVNAHNNTPSIKNVQPGTSVFVTASGVKHNSLPAPIAQGTLNIVQDAANNWHLQWV